MKKKQQRPAIEEAPDTRNPAPRRDPPEEKLQDVYVINTKMLKIKRLFRRATKKVSTPLTDEVSDVSNVHLTTSNSSSSHDVNSVRSFSNQKIRDNKNSENSSSGELDPEHPKHKPSPAHKEELYRNLKLPLRKTHTGNG